MIKAPSWLYVKKVPGKGRGVFTARRIKKGAILEISPVIVLSTEDCSHVRKTVLDLYRFAWRGNRKQSAIALGFGSLFNHSYQPNAICKRGLRGKKIFFLALRDISAGEEITINYKGPKGLPDGKGPAWLRVT
ncbi:MAG: SET domain-containing protein [Candidatus Liptonbacteria bacterium]|nr:SET domain-containing protein [Candidatus Liptonbacteria bacterium]